MKAKENNVNNTLSTNEFNGMTIIDRLEALTEKVRNSQLKPELFIENAALIQSLATSLNLTPCQAVMLCPFFDNAFLHQSKNDLKNFFGCKASDIIRFLTDIESLAMAGYIENQRRGDSFGLTDEAQEAFSSNRGLKKDTFEGLDNISFMNALNQAFADKHEGRSSKNILFKKVFSLIKGNKQLTIAKNMTKLKFSDLDLIILAVFLSRRIALTEDNLCLHWLRNIFDDEMSGITKSFQSGTCVLIKKGYIERIEKGKNKGRYQLTDKAVGEFLSEYTSNTSINEDDDDDLFGNPFSDDNNNDDEKQSTTILPDDINAKEMYYGTDDQKGIDTLKKLLSETQFNQVVKNLKERKMRTGFCCLFYGTPGTGKTETVLQIAKATNRKVMKVDISNIRDQWYGNTEKNVKKIFADYAATAKGETLKPILLFNEADAIFSTRSNSGSSNTSKTENAIQNILLDEMERFDGILIATTNLQGNLDAAFERRFLYKLEFHQPSVEAKTAIWKSVIPELDEQTAMTLATDYDLSGGQIENISRKTLIDQLISGSAPSLEQLRQLCEQEKLQKDAPKRQPMGFK